MSAWVAGILGDGERAIRDRLKQFELAIDAAVTVGQIDQLAARLLVLEQDVARVRQMASAVADRLQNAEQESR